MSTFCLLIIYPQPISRNFLKIPCIVCSFVPSHISEDHQGVAPGLPQKELQEEACEAKEEEPVFPISELAILALGPSSQPSKLAAKRDTISRDSAFIFFFFFSLMKDVNEVAKGIVGRKHEAFQPFSGTGIYDIWLLYRTTSSRMACQKTEAKLEGGRRVFKPGGTASRFRV